MQQTLETRSNNFLSAISCLSVTQSHDNLVDIKTTADKMYCYHFLGLSPSCTEADIKKAYRTLALKYHPDKAGTASEERMKQLNEAYEEALSFAKKAAEEAMKDLHDDETEWHRQQKREEEGIWSTSVEAAVKINFSELTRDLEKSLGRAFGSGAEGHIGPILDYIGQLGAVIDKDNANITRGKGSRGSKIENEIHQHLCMLANDINETLSELREWDVPSEEHWSYLRQCIGPRIGRILNLIKQLKIYDRSDWISAQAFFFNATIVGILHKTGALEASCGWGDWARDMEALLAQGWGTQQCYWSLEELHSCAATEEVLGKKYI